MAGGAEVKGRTIEIPRYNDVWMDNGVETFYQILKEAENGGFSVEIEDNSTTLTVSDFSKFKTYIGNAMKIT